jgi:ferredoxin
LFGRIGRKIFRKHFYKPTNIDKPMRYLKYIILIFAAVTAWNYGTLWMAPYDPYSAYSHLTSFSDSIKEDPLAIIGFILLAVTVLGSFMYERFFCKYLCPLGALYGIIGKLSPTRVERDDNLCTHCKLCNKACPVNINVEKATKITSTECINCNECVLACPKKGALEIKTAKIVLHPTAMLLIVLVLFFGTIAIAQVTGNFQVIPSAIKEGDIISISGIKGYYSIEEAAIATGLSLKEFYKKLDIPEQVSKNIKMKDISKEVPEYNFDDAKEKAGEAESTTNKTTAPDRADNTQKIDISGIKGSMTIRQAAEFLKIEQKEFYKLFKIPEDVPAQTQMNSISSVSLGYDFEKVKESLK